ncbi:nucleotidyl transferase AbiEii/AbiGii toxin family protein [Halioxenophilus sp. WMMB6]|uniref:nucleotidyl transferase AbiEii/AbiGii toxin family protein n=1 Tax=Halioxenophilus sp. WMMB6 TaxID=3073815 RepID=UPI00295E4F29|nr:nucleotidyl transferase AbiEii/AbiGii toxin family protein [Halioxenophilus sp. WMMB6]
MKNTNYDFNLRQLTIVAEALGPLLPRVTFVGGCTTVLLVDEAAYSGVRQTEDVDVIVDVGTYLQYQKFAESLRQQGFVEDTSGPICRWLYRADNARIKLDVMSADAEALGFTNRWYKTAVQNATKYRLQDNLYLQVISPVDFLATKFEAFLDRGKGDYFSHDMEDIVFVLENRRDFIVELMAASDEHKRYFAEQANNLLNDSFLNILPGLMTVNVTPNPVLNTLKIMAKWG